MNTNLHSCISSFTIENQGYVVLLKTFWETILAGTTLEWERMLLRTRHKWTSVDIFIFKNFYIILEFLREKKIVSNTTTQTITQVCIPLLLWGC